MTKNYLTKHIYYFKKFKKKFKKSSKKSSKKVQKKDQKKKYKLLEGREGGWRIVIHSLMAAGKNLYFTISAPTKKFQETKYDFKFRGRTYPLFEDIISYPYPSPKKGYCFLSLSRQKKDMDIYPISFVKMFASIFTVSEQKSQTW
jgi:hypothetical protein